MESGASIYGREWAMTDKDGQVMTGAQALVESLERVGVDVVFGSVDERPARAGGDPGGCHVLPYGIPCILASDPRR